MGSYSGYQKLGKIFKNIHKYHKIGNFRFLPIFCRFEFRLEPKSITILFYIWFLIFRDKECVVWVSWRDSKLIKCWLPLLKNEVIQCILMSDYFTISRPLAFKLFHHGENSHRTKCIFVSRLDQMVFSRDNIKNSCRSML